jgi:DNA invertase Pin-like site-specific DNA recombinase
MTERQKTIRCAIYTRKSHETVLEQDFNSLDAQREACSAYILSQKHEGWQESETHYDDGGFSGGNLERPGLQSRKLERTLHYVHPTAGLVAA